MVGATMMLWVLAAAPQISAEVGVRSLLQGEPRQFAAIRLLDSMQGFNTMVEVSGDRDVLGEGTRASLRFGVGANRWQIRLAAARVGAGFEPSGEVRFKLLPTMTVYAEGVATTDLASTLVRVGAKYSGDRFSWSLEGSSRGDASMVVSLSLI